MFLRRNCRIKNGSSYDYWTLVESIRTSKGPRQRVVATIGKLPGLNKKEMIGWERIRSILNGSHILKGSFFEKEEEIPKWANVEVNGVSVERIRQFGDIYLGLILWKKLKLDEIFERLQEKGKEDVEWDIMFCITALARFCNPSSDLAISESWYEKTALEDFTGAAVEKVNESRLYRTLDRIVEHKDEVCKNLQERYRDWFGTDFEFLIYDITSTYFEGQGKKNPQARRGYSRDHRPDCVQVCIGLVVTMEGLPIGYEVFDGNRRDVTTLEDMMELMEDKYGKANRVWVFDRGIVSEENIEHLNERGAGYIVGTSRSMLKNFEAELTKKGWEEVEPEVEVKVARHPAYKDELFILCRSKARENKDRAVVERQIKKLELEFKKIQKAIRNGKLKDDSKIERRIGRWMGRYATAEKMFDVSIKRDSTGKPVDLIIIYKEETKQWAEKAYGSYLLRTNINEEEPKKLWKIYMQLNQAESAFKMSKTDIGIRPIYHHTENRTQAHIFVCFLGLVMLKCLELWMASAGLGRSPNKLLKEIKEVRSMDVILPVKNRSSIRLRVVAKPDDHVRVLLHKMNIKLPNRAKIVQNVVDKIGG